MKCMRKLVQERTKSFSFWKTAALDLVSASCQSLLFSCFSIFATMHLTLFEGIGVESLPAPLKLGCTPEDNDEKVNLCITVNCFLIFWEDFCQYCSFFQGRSVGPDNDRLKFAKKFASRAWFLSNSVLLSSIFFSQHHTCSHYSHCTCSITCYHTVFSLS